MGQETVVPSTKPLAEALAALAADGVPCQLAMVDGQLVHPSTPPPPTWTEVRLRTPAGMVTLRRRAAQIALTVFGNAAPDLIRVRDQIAAALGAGPG